MFKVDLLTLTNVILPLSNSYALHIPNSLLTVLVLSRQTTWNHVHFVSINYTHLNNSLLLYSIIFQSLQKSLILLITYKHTISHSISVKGLFWKFCYDVHGEIACVLNDAFASNIVYFWRHFMPLSLHSVFPQLSPKIYVQLFSSSLSLFSFLEF